MKAQEASLSVVSNNLANIEKVGFKRDRPIFKAHPEMLLRRENREGLVTFPLGSYDLMPVVGKLGTGVELNEVYTDHTQGAPRETGKSLDFALTGKGFFTVRTEDGLRYTRDGTFQITKDLELVTKQGYLVMGEEGPISLKRENFNVSRDGQIFHNENFMNDPGREVDLQNDSTTGRIILDRLMIRSFDRPMELRKYGEDLYIETEGSGPAINVVFGETEVQQGFLEASNVKPIDEMIRLIEIHRHYEANQKMIAAQDQATSQLIGGILRG